MIKEMNLTNREIRLVAFEMQDVDVKDPRFMNNLSNRAQSFILKGMDSIRDAGYVARRCYFIVNGVKISN